MDFSLTDEQREMVATVRKLRQKVLAPNAIRWLNGDFPYDSMKGLAEIGVLGMAVRMRSFPLQAGICCISCKRIPQQVGNDGQIRPVSEAAVGDVGPLRAQFIDATDRIDCNLDLLRDLRFDFFRAGAGQSHAHIDVGNLGPRHQVDSKSSIRKSSKGDQRHRHHDRKDRTPNADVCNFH